MPCIRYNGYPEENMPKRNPYVLPMKLHTKSQTFHDRREERGGAKNQMPELLEQAEERAEHKCALVIPGTFIMCGEVDQYCSVECQLEKENKNGSE